MKRAEVPAKAMVAEATKVTAEDAFFRASWSSDGKAVSSDGKTAPEEAWLVAKREAEVVTRRLQGLANEAEAMEAELANKA
jgi:hypothetical protein